MTNSESTYLVAAMKKPDFYETVSRGRSLILVPWRSAALHIANRLNRERKSLQPVAFAVTPRLNLEVALQYFNRLDMKMPGALVGHPAALSHGFRVFVDRIVWVGTKPSGPRDVGYAEYMQALGRGSNPWYTPAVMHYDESETDINSFTMAEPEDGRL